MASGDIVFAAQAVSNEPPGTAAALMGQVAVASTNRNRMVILFPSSADREAIFLCLLTNYAGGGVSARIRGSMSGANTGTKVVRMEAAWERLQTGDVHTTDGFASAQVVEATVDNTANTEFVATIPFTHGAQMDSTANKEWFRLRVRRLNSGLTGDNASGTFQLIRVDGVED
jgi:hypothetical protein